jgi:selenoprotein W-related protein
LAAELQKGFGVDCQIIESSGGVFEISVDGKLIFSKKSLDRFPEDGEIAELIRAL